MTLTRRTFTTGSAALAAAAAITRPARAQTVIRWGELLPTSHPQVQMIDRIAKEVKEKSGGKIEIQSFPNGQLGSGRDMIEAVTSGALTFTTDGAAALGQFLPQLSVIEAPYLWRDAAHMAKVADSPIFADLNKDLVAKRGMRMLAVTYYGKRHLTSGSKQVKTVADMAGFKLRVPPVDTFRAMAEAWGARATPVNFNELYLALSQGAVDGQENPLPTIQSAKLNEVQKFLVLTGHIITPRLVIANEDFLKKLSDGDRGIVMTAIKNGAAWQDKELADQEGQATEALKKAGMTVIEPDVESFRKPVLAKVPAQFEGKWGKGTWDKLLAL
jgi:tripartite ATP-independent transporter DctP family solute receptor